MRSATRFAVLFAAATLFVFPVFADFGGGIDNDSSVTKKDDADTGQEDTFSFWVSALMGEHFRFDASAHATVSIDSPNFYADVEKLTITGNFPPVKDGLPQFGFDLGKFYQSDFSSRVFADSFVGARFRFSYAKANLKLTFGYTGLNNKYYSSIVMSRMDALDDADDDVVFAAPRFIGSLGFELPELVARQTLNLSAVVQEDLRHVFDDVTEEGDEIYDPTSGGRMNTQYWGAGLSGPLVPSLYYDLYFYVGTGRMLTFEDDSQSTTGQSYQYENIYSYLFGGSFRYYAPSFLNSSAGVKFLYASGDKDHVSYIEGNTTGDSAAFVPIADGAFGLAFTPKSSNLLASEISYSVKPFTSRPEQLIRSLQATVKVTPFYKPVAGVMSESEVNPAKGSGYLGTEFGGAVNLRPYSDLGFGIAIGVFVPDGDMFVEDMDSPWTVGKFTFSFSY